MTHVVPRYLENEQFGTILQRSRHSAHLATLLFFSVLLFSLMFPTFLLPHHTPRKAREIRCVWPSSSMYYHTPLPNQVQVPPIVYSSQARLRSFVFYENWGKNSIYLLSKKIVQD